VALNVWRRALKFIVDSPRANLPTDGVGEALLAIGPAVFLVLIHVLWFFGYIDRVAQVESDKTKELDRELRAKAGLGWVEPPKTPRRWTYVVQILITAMLVGVIA
jgi:hypothetical protein